MNISLKHNKKLEVKPEIDHQLLGINDDCLVVQNFNVKHSITMGWSGVWGFFGYGLPFIIYFTILPWLPPYGYRDDGVAITSFLDKVSGLPAAAWGVVFIVFILTFLLLGGMTLGLAYAFLRRTSKSFSPIVFNRKKQIISTFEGTKEKEISWASLSATIRTKTHMSGYVMHRTPILMINNLGNASAIEGNPFADGDDDVNRVGAEYVWEYTRCFMEEGAKDLNVPASHSTGIANLDKQAMYSYDFKSSLESNWPWPIVKSKDKNVVNRIFGILFWPIRVVFFFHNVATDWLWRKMCLRLLKNSKVTPAYSFKQCETKVITPRDAEDIITPEEALFNGELAYSEVKRRLG